jgi:hypothetical protein
MISATLWVLAFQAQDPADAERQLKSRINEVRKLANSSDEATRLKAVEELGTLFDEEARSVLSAKMTSDTDAVRVAAAKALLKHRKPVCAQSLGNAIQANVKNEKLVKAFVDALAELDMCASIPVLFTVLESRFESGRDALEALVKLGCPEAVQPLVAFLKKAETEEKKPDFFENIQNVRQQPGQVPRPRGPDKIENKTKNKPLAALAPKVRESLKALTGKSYDAHKDWASALASGSLSPRVSSVFLCEAAREKYEIAAGKAKKCPHAGESKSDHEDTFLKHRRE